MIIESLPDSVHMEREVRDCPATQPRQRGGAGGAPTDGLRMDFVVRGLTDAYTTILIDQTVSCPTCDGYVGNAAKEFNWTAKQWHMRKQQKKYGPCDNRQRLGPPQLRQM